VNFNKFSQLGIWFHLYLFLMQPLYKKNITSASSMAVTMVEDSAVTECESGFLASVLRYSESFC